MALIARIETAAAEHLEHAFQSSLRPVINGTGVVLHTNLGRAPLAASAIDRIGEVSRGYSTLEYDLAAGRRGRREVHAERLLCRLTGAESAVVVNNNAAATLIVLAALAAGREVIVSRGELVEIGGGFRVPDVMAQSGAVLREVGTTNRTRRERLRRSARRSDGPDSPGASVELPHRGVHRTPGPRRSRRARHSLLGAGGRRFGQRPSGSDGRSSTQPRASHPSGRASPRVWTSAASAATSCSAVPRPASSSAAHRRSTGSGVTRSCAPCASTS